MFGRPLTDSDLVLILRDPKTSAHMGRLQHVLITDESTVNFARWHLSCLPPGAPLWPYSRHVARAYFTRLLTRLHLRDSGLTLGSLRPGGATHLYKDQNCEISRLMFKGRWKALGTLQCYI